MKSTQSYRTRYRNHFNTPVFWIDMQTRKKYKGRICNISEKGLYIESNDALKVGSDITVGIPGTPETEPAQLVWNREMIMGKKPTFGFGSKFSKPLNRWWFLPRSIEKSISQIKSTLAKINRKRAYLSTGF